MVLLFPAFLRLFRVDHVARTYISFRHGSSFRASTHRNAFSVTAERGERAPHVGTAQLATDAGARAAASYVILSP